MVATIGKTLWTTRKQTSMASINKTLFTKAPQWIWHVGAKNKISIMRRWFDCLYETFKRTKWEVELIRRLMWSEYTQNNNILIYPIINFRKWYGKMIQFTTARKALKNIEIIMSNLPILDKEDYIA